MQIRLVIELDQMEETNEGAAGFMVRMIELPFLPVPSMMLMIGETASWNQLIVEEVAWFHLEGVVDCQVRCCKEQDDSFVPFMQSHGWTLR
jgi:hypothetical protein